MNFHSTQVSRAAVVVSALTLFSIAGPVPAYPLDGYESTGITRLEAQRLIQIGKAEGKKRPPGELLPLKMVDLRLQDYPDFELPPSDPKLTAELKQLIGNEVDRYGVALLDLSDIENPRYAEWHGDQHQNPGSVGKVLVALAIFQALADLYPDDIEAREQVLRDTVITADIFSVYDHHTVRLYNPETRKLVRRPIQEGDQASLWTYLDWMMSPSSNSAAGMCQKHLILMAHYGKDYPVSPEEEKRFFQQTKSKELGEIFARAIQDPVTRNGLKLDALRQGSFLTHEGKKRVPGESSHATPRELMQFLLKMEQGKLVDPWSSREIKRLLYITERRIRYASAGALRKSAVYFKSGSLYSCEPEEGFKCRKYHGNKRNFMNSIALVESPAGQNRLYYMATVLSNVLRKNSAVDHQDLARAIHAKLLADHPQTATAVGGSSSTSTFGENFIGYEEERRELQLALETQEALLALGYDIGEIDGQIGPKSRKAIEDFQNSQEMAANGQPSASLLQTMRQVAHEKGLARPAAPVTSQ